MAGRIREHAPLFEEEESADAVAYREAAKVAVMERLNTVPGRGRLWRVMAMRIAVAAAVVGMIAVAGIRLAKPKNVQLLSQKKTKTAASRNRAMLELFNGQVITLEQLSVGQKNTSRPPSP